MKRGTTPGARRLAAFYWPGLFAGPFPGLLAAGSPEAEAARRTCGEEPPFWRAGERRRRALAALSQAAFLRSPEENQARSVRPPASGVLTTVMIN